VTFPHDVTVAERVLGAGFAGSEPASPLVKRGSGAAEHL
jgi:hypothetical protein